MNTLWCFCWQKLIQLVTLDCSMQTQLEAAGGQQSTQLLRGHGPRSRSAQQVEQQRGLYCCCTLQPLLPTAVAMHKS